MTDLATAWRPFEPGTDNPEPKDDETRCAVCGWHLAETLANGCVRGCCSLRPRPANLYAPERAAR